MRPSKSLLASATAAAILGVIGLAYAESFDPLAADDAVPAQTRLDASTPAAPAAR